MRDIVDASTPHARRAAPAPPSRRSTMSFPCATGERTTRMCHWPGNDTSAAKRPWPGSSGRSSSRATERPTNLAGAVISRASRSAAGAHGLDDVLIAGAAAQVRRQHVEQVVVADVRLALQHADRQHQKARRAEAALQAVVIHEGLLHRMQRVAIGQSFDGADFLALGLHGEHQAGAHRLAIDDHGAGAADAVLAADMGAGLAAILADGIGQRAARLDSDGVVAAIDGERDARLCRSCCFLCGLLGSRNAARIRCGVAGISSISTPNGVSASLMALSTAAGAPMAPPSPRPLALVMDCGARAFRCGAARSAAFHARSAACSRRAFAVRMPPLSS